MPEPANPEGPLPSVIESQPNHTPLSPQINSAQSTSTTEAQKPEPQNPIQIKIQEIENCREQVIKEVEKKGENPSFIFIEFVHPEGFTLIL